MHTTANRCALGHVGLLHGWAGQVSPYAEPRGATRVDLRLGAMLDAQPALRGAIKWGGLAYLLWLAFKLAQALSKTKVAAPSALRPRSSLSTLLAPVSRM